MVTSLLITLIFLFICGCAGENPMHLSRPDPAPRQSRSFDFTYYAKISLPKSPETPSSVAVAPSPRQVRVWFPVPQSDINQEILLLEIKTPVPYTLHKEPLYNNKIAFFELLSHIPEEIELEMRFRATRYEDHNDVDLGLPTENVGQFLQPSRLGASIPEVEDIATQIKTTHKEPKSQMYAAFTYVLDNMEYKKVGAGWGKGDTRWACSARYGNCTDYHALFIALAQAMDIPAVFEIGFPLPSDKKEGRINGYHCWSHFYLKEKGWVPVDVSEADKNPRQQEYFFGAHDPNRVKFTTGRDILLVPEQKGNPLNFFIYPYVEVDGAPHDDMELNFTFKDLSK
jgi:transglutaminase-like putative cysteine protease